MKKLKISFTTFLKFCASNTKGKIEVLRDFTEPGGYDFYKVMKKVVGELARREITLAEAEHRIARIKREPERKHTLEAIKKFHAWLVEQDFRWKSPPKGAFESSSGKVVVKLEPEVAFLDRRGVTNVLYLWNLAKPELRRELAAEGLCLLVRELGRSRHERQFGIFNLRIKRILTEELIAANSERQLKLDLMILEAIWEDLHDSSLSREDVISHISSLRLPPPTPAI